MNFDHFILDPIKKMFKRSEPSTHPAGHLVHFRSSMVVVEDDDRQHDRRCHHEHDAIEISAYAQSIVSGYQQVQYS